MLAPFAARQSTATRPSVPPATVLPQRHGTALSASRFAVERSRVLIRHRLPPRRQSKGAIVRAAAARDQRPARELPRMRFARRGPLRPARTGLVRSEIVIGWKLNKRAWCGTTITPFKAKPAPANRQALSIKPCQ
jgi:hypothetical protein